MFKILFYHANDTIGITDNKQLYLGVAALYLKTHLDKHKPDIAAQIEWLIPQQHKVTDDEFVDMYNDLKPDIICTSHYIWNNVFLLEQLGRVRSRIPSSVPFVVGGPSIDVNIDPDFFNKYPFVDYAFYGSAEVAFADLLENLFNKKKPIAFNTSNIAWYDKDKQKSIVAEFKYVPQLPISPYTNNIDLFSRMVKEIQSKDISVIVPYDLTRGCPYSCTFCDWNSGLTNKTTRRKGSYEEEIDLFQKLNIRNIYLSDANVGQYPEDIDMIGYFAKKNIEEGTDFKLDGNFSKLRKENNLKIYHLLAQANLITEFAGFTVSVQDINPEILKNIDRPDVGWPVHLQMIRELKEAYPHVHSKIQLIQGLPGQTVASWRNTLAEICRDNLQLQIFISELLPASPAARDKEYQDKFQFKYSNSERFNGSHYFRGVFPESCTSFSKEDFVDMTILSQLYSALMIGRAQSKISFDIERVVDRFLESKEYKMLYENLYTNWTKHDKFYYSISINGTPRDVTACTIFGAGQEWSSSLNLIKIIAETVGPMRNEFIKSLVSLKKDRVQVNIKEYEGFV